MLLGLPEPILAGILTEWVELKSVLVLDMAACSRISRANYLAVLRFHGTVFKSVYYHDSCHEECLTAWTKARRAKFRIVNLTCRMDTSDTIEFFRAVAKHVVTMKMTFVCFSGFKLLEEANVQFPQLRQLFVRDAHGVCPPEFLMFLEKRLSSLETLSVQHCPIGSLPPPSCSAASRLQTLLWDNPCEDTPEQAVKSALAGYCTHLLRFISPLFGVNEVVLRELGAHCPRLQQLHVRFKSKGEGAEAMVALVSVLQGCRALRILDLTIDARLTQEQAIALAEHCYRPTALKVSTIHEDTLALMLPSLGSLQHLMVGSIAVTSPAPLLSLAVHCRQLRSLSFTFSRTGRIENALVTLFQNLSFLEDLRLCVSEAGCLTDSVLLTLAAHCRDLRSLHVRGMSDISDFTEESVTGAAAGLSPPVRAANLSPQLPA